MTEDYTNITQTHLVHCSENERSETLTKTASKNLSLYSPLYLGNKRSREISPSIVLLALAEGHLRSCKLIAVYYCSTSLATYKGGLRCYTYKGTVHWW